MHLNLIQIAESLGVEETVVLTWVRHEALPCVKDGGRLLFDGPAVAGWAAERGMAARAGFLAEPPPSGRVQWPLESMLGLGGIRRDVAPAGVRQALAEVVGSLRVVPAIRQMLVQRVLAAGAITWAPVGNGMALPHLRSRVSPGREAGIISILLLNGDLEIDEETPDGQAIRQIIFFVAPTPRAHLEILAQLSFVLSRGPLGKLLRNGGSDEEIFAAIAGKPQEAKA